MKIIYMGTPDFAVPSLQKLIDSEHSVEAVFTQPDKPKGRGHKMQFSPVKELAVAHDIPVHQPLTLKDESVVELIKNIDPDVIVVVAYGRLLPKAVLDIPKYGCVNVHGSLLPKYRGAAPIQWSVLNGDKVAGVTTMYMGVGMDTGDMLLKAETEIGGNETSGELFDRLKDIGADLLMETLEGLFEGRITAVPQNEAEATHAPMITKEMSEVDWTKSAREIHNQIRGLNPWPCAVTSYNGKRMKVYAAEVMEGNGAPATLFKKDNKMCVYCGEGALVLTDIQLENGKRMSGDVFLLGHPIDKTSLLGN